MIPKHVAIILDGNRRWAKAHGLPALMGHKKGYEQLKLVGEHILSRGVEYCTVFAFSTENWNRSEEEVAGLMEIFLGALTMELPYFTDRGIRLRVLGSRERLSAKLVAAIENAETVTGSGAHGQLNLCLNYGGRAEILEGVREMIRAGVSPEDVSEERFARALWSHDMPDPDIIIRTSGEQRLSGFLTWSGTYSELFFVEKNWPDFGTADFDAVLDEFAARGRRFGK
jgi:undecaprenyl diphosphate synthase